MKNYALPPGYNFFRSLHRSYKQVKDPLGSMQESMKRFNGTYTVGLFGTGRFIATQDPGFADHVLRANNRSYHKSALQTDTLGKFVGKGLLTSNGDYWLRQRRLIQPGFHTEKIRALYQIMERTVDDFLDQMPCGKEVDFYPLMNGLAFRIVVNTLFNVNVSRGVQDELSRLIFEIQEYLIRDLRQFYKRWWHRLSGEDSEHLAKGKRVRDIIRSMIRDRKSSGEHRGDLLDMLLEARYEDNGQPMNEEQLIDELTILIIAGHETTANALAWALYLLAKHPDKQSTARVEASTNNEALASDMIQAVVKETMRLYPPAYISDRVCLEDDHYGGFDIPAGTIVLIFYYGMHRDPKHWNDPSAFRPERFARDSPEKDRTKAFFPFGSGPRLCIGNNFALAEMAIFLHRFLRRFEIRPGKSEPRTNALVTLKPENVMLTAYKVSEVIAPHLAGSGQGS
jgi:cytochrome P450